ncbi:hypothetical protein FACS1894147_03300 [Spirochaetia bacterium]|nr:hypothetical protein FACS1894147_03300 [Spirochaetia bacterium]
MQEFIKCDHCDDHSVCEGNTKPCPFPDVPVEGDFIVSSCGPLGCKSNVSVLYQPRYCQEFSGPDQEKKADDYIRLTMKAEHFYPNVWTQDDHGGYTPRRP